MYSVPCLEPPAYQSHHGTQNFCSFYLEKKKRKVTEAHRGGREVPLISSRCWIQRVSFDRRQQGGKDTAISNQTASAATLSSAGRREHWPAITSAEGRQQYPSQPRISSPENELSPKTWPRGVTQCPSLALSYLWPV